MRIRPSGILLLALLAGPAAPAIASTEVTWAVSANAAAETTHTRTSSPRAAAELVLAGEAEQRSDPILNVVDEDTGVGIWTSVLSWASAASMLRLTAGGEVPLLGAHARGRARVLDIGVSGVPGPGMILSCGAVDLAYQLDWHLRPSLSRRRDLWRRTYTRQEQGLAIHGMQLYSGTSRYGLVHFSMHTATLELHDPSAPAPRHEYLIDLTLFSLRRTRALPAPELALDIFVVDLDAIESSTSAMTGGIDFVRLRGFRLAGPVFVDLAGGFSGTSTLILGGEPDGTGGHVIPTEDLPLLTTGVGRARIHGYHGPVQAALEAGRGLYLTYDMELALEERITGRLDWRRAANGLTLEAFTARTHLWLDRDTLETTLTGGAGASWSRRLTDNLDLGVSVEMARSFYASLDGDARPRAERAVRGITSLTGHLGSPR